jgi:hypothetical protein
VGDRDFDVDAASTTPSVGVEKRDDLVPRIEELLGLIKLSQSSRRDAMYARTAA